MTVQLVVGPAEHGVTRLALELAAMPALAAFPVVRLDEGSAGDLARATAGQPAHVHVTDRLFGASATQAADRLVGLARAVPLTVTLHDLPQPSDGARNHPLRADAYARVARAARGVVVSSEHERALLDDVLAQRPGTPVDVTVVPLPVDGGPVADRPGPRWPRDLVVLGFLYPGKGHEEAVDALPGLPDDVGVLALGRPSDGHDDLVGALTRRAAVHGRRFRVSGYVPDDELTGRLRTAAVPVAAHRHLSASGSIGSWLAAGRRPLVPRSRYVDELEARCPGSLLVYEDLRAAAAGALDDPASTWLAPDVRVGPSRTEAAQAYRGVIDRLLGPEPGRRPEPRP